MAVLPFNSTISRLPTTTNSTTPFGLTFGPSNRALSRALGPSVPGGAGGPNERGRVGSEAVVLSTQVPNIDFLCFCAKSPHATHATCNTSSPWPKLFFSSSPTPSVRLQAHLNNASRICARSLSQERRWVSTNLHPEVVIGLTSQSFQYLPAKSQFRELRPNRPTYSRAS